MRMKRLLKRLELICLVLMLSLSMTACGEKEERETSKISKEEKSDKKNKDKDDDEEEDPKLDSAIKLAVESGKISTSLIQRKLSLGYGRAAKLIDVMERRGIVGKPEGQKPRSVLITREQYLEMQMKNAERAETGEAPL